MSFPPEFLDEIRLRTPLADAIGRRVKLTRRGREWVGLCPFHKEKTPSFTVNEDKGFFHCLAAETGVILKDGVHPIASLAGTSQEVLTRGGKWTRARFEAYGVQKLYRIRLSRNGVAKSVFATDGHRWFVRGVKRDVPTTELQPGHRLDSVLPDRRYDWTLDPAGVRHGIVFGNGTDQRGLYGLVTLHGDKDAALSEWFSGFSPAHGVAECGKPYIRFNGGRELCHLKSLPSLDADDAYLLGFIAGYLAADGHVAKDGSVMLHSAQPQNLQWVRAASTRLGIATYGITTASRGGLATDDADVSRIHFVTSTLDPAIALGRVAKQRLEASQKTFERLGWCVQAVEETARVEEVYCATVPGEHAFAIEDNILTGNCFGCGAHGDVIGFAMRIDNLGFPEAVERLARDAGLALPVRTPEEREKAKKRQSLYAVLEAACAWFEAQLAGAGGAAGREYLAARGVDSATVAAFRLGWAPDSRGALRQALKSDEITEAMLVDAGLLKAPDDGGAPYSYFRGRIVFPITDRGGRVVGFGGRALGEREPKYLNSPETALFRKGHLLYNLAPARKAARDAGEVVVGEGYMDVIALHRAGLEAAVAPLGTALTEAQIEELWRLAPEPVVCFDGDDAGRRAALRAVERALPLLRPGRSLRFAALPAGEDPDSLLAARGATALREALDRARPLADMVWELAVGGRPIDTPERRAGAHKRLVDAARRIRDLEVRRHYEHLMRNRLWAAITGRPPRGARAGARRFGAERPPEPPLSDPLGSGAAGSGERRERLLVRTVLQRPELLANVGEEFAAVPVESAELDRLRQAILDIFSQESALDSATLKRHLSGRGFAPSVDRLLAPRDWSERRLEDQASTAAGGLSKLERQWRHVLALHRRAVALEAELKAAQEALAEDMTEETFARFDALRRQLERIAVDEADDAALAAEGGDAVAGE